MELEGTHDHQRDPTRKAKGDQQEFGELVRPEKTEGVHYISRNNAL